MFVDVQHRSKFMRFDASSALLLHQKKRGVNDLGIMRKSGKGKWEPFKKVNAALRLPFSNPSSHYRTSTIDASIHSVPYFFSNKARICIRRCFRGLLTLLHDCFLLRESRAFILNRKLFIERLPFFPKKFETTDKKIWFFNRFMSICVHWENSSLLKNLDFSILDVHSIDDCKCKNCIKCVIWI